jgi:hypothetical protein
LPGFLGRPNSVVVATSSLSAVVKLQTPERDVLLRKASRLHPHAIV